MSRAAGSDRRKHSMDTTTPDEQIRGKWPRWLWRFVRRLSAPVWGWEIARTGDHAVLVKCHEDNCRAISQLAHELGQTRDAEMLARVQLDQARRRADECATTADWHRSRYKLLQREQCRMRDPERRLVCDVLANAQLLPDPDGERYGLRSENMPPACGDCDPCLGGRPDQCAICPAPKPGINS